MVSEKRKKNQQKLQNPYLLNVRDVTSFMNNPNVEQQDCDVAPKEMTRKIYVVGRESIIDEFSEKIERWSISSDVIRIWKNLQFSCWPGAAGSPEALILGMSLGGDWQGVLKLAEVAYSYRVNTRFIGDSSSKGRSNSNIIALKRSSFLKESP